MGICNTGGDFVNSRITNTLYTHLAEQCPLAVGFQFQLRAYYYLWALGNMVVSGQFLRQYSPVATFRVANHMPMPVKRKKMKFIRCCYFVSNPQKSGTAREVDSKAGLNSTNCME
jgi:hypothetical protein